MLHGCGRVRRGRSARPDRSSARPTRWRGPARTPLRGARRTDRADDRARNCLEAQVSRHVGIFDRTQGFAAFDAHSTGAWLSRRVRISPKTASEQVRVARQLSELPEASRAFAAGEVSFQHAQAITRVLEDAPAEVVRESEPELVKVAQRVHPHELRKLTSHLRHTFAPEAVVRDEAAVRDRRYLHLSESQDGLTYLDAALDTETGAMVRTALDAQMGPPASDDKRSWAQRRMS